MDKKSRITHHTRGSDFPVTAVHLNQLITAPPPVEQVAICYLSTDAILDS